MAQCDHGNPHKTAPDAVIDSLPECQAAGGRHKCPVCAYNEGVEVKAGKRFNGPADECSHGETAPQDMLKDLPEYQGGKGRHKCCYTAYQAGLDS